MTCKCKWNSKSLTPNRITLFEIINSGLNVSGPTLRALLPQTAHPSHSLGVFPVFCWLLREPADGFETPQLQTFSSTPQLCHWCFFMFWRYTGAVRTQGICSEQFWCNELFLHFSLSWFPPEFLLVLNQDRGPGREGRGEGSIFIKYFSEFVRVASKVWSSAVSDVEALCHVPLL